MLFQLFAETPQLCLDSFGECHRKARRYHIIPLNRKYFSTCTYMLSLLNIRVASEKFCYE